MKRIIDIPEEVYDHCKTINDYVYQAIANSTSLGSLIYDIKKEINELPKLRYSSGERVYLDEVLEIIDKHIGKEEKDGNSSGNV